MITASSKFIDALAYSHESLSRVTVDGVVVPVAAGTLTCDWTRNVRRTGTLRVADDPQTPDLVRSITTSSEVVIEKGIRFLDRTEEYITVATMYVQEMSRTMTDQYVDLSLSDAGQKVDDYPLIQPWAPVSGGTAMTVRAAIKYLVEEALPSAPTWTESSATNPATADGTLYTAGTGRWAAVTELAKMISAQVYQDVDGSWVIKPISESTASVYDVYAGPGGVLINATGKASRRDTYNGAAIEWGTTDVPGGIVLVTDDDVNSPTYWLGTWGKKPKATTKLPVTTEAEAISAATTQLMLSKGAQSGLGLSTVYNPTLEPGDVIGVTLRGGGKEYHIIDSLQYGIIEATMTATTRVVTT